LETAEIDLRKYIEVLWKWRLVIVLLTGAAVAASGVFSYFVLSPVYETKVTMLVANATQSQQSTNTASGSVADTVSRIPTMTLNTYMNQITSPYFLARVASKLGVPNLAADSLGSMITTQVLKDTNLIEVRVQNTDRALAAKIANTMASEFVQFVSEQNQERMSKSLAFLVDQEAMLKKELSDAYAALNALQVRPDSASAISRQLSSLQQVIVTLRQDIARQQAEVSILESDIRQLERDIAASSQNPESPTPAYQSLVASKAEKTRQLKELSAEVAAMQAQLSSIQEESARLEAKYAAAQNDEAVAKANVQRLESTLNLLSSKMVEAQMAHSLNLGETTISVVSPALEPRYPVKPRKMLNMAVAGVLGGFVSVLLTFVLEYMDNTIKTQDDVQRLLNLGTMAVIPVFEERGKSKR